MSTTAVLECTREFGADVLFVLHTLPGEARVVDGRAGTCAANGASVAWVSQYPLEDEVLFPANTILMPLRVPVGPTAGDAAVFHFCPLVQV